MEIFIKDPDAMLDYGFDWSLWLAEGETIASSAWTVTPGITKSAAAHTDSATVVWLSGGEAGRDYVLTNEIETSDDRIDDRSFKVRVRER